MSEAENMLKNRRYSLVGFRQSKLISEPDIDKDNKQDKTFTSCKATEPSNISKGSLKQASAVESPR